jgi:hypothetical protein
MATPIQWPFIAKYALNEDYTDYLSRSLVMGLEIELDWKDSNRPNGCGNCNGEGRVNCYDCDGDGTIDCYDCYGEGTIDCIRCEGSGEKKINQYTTEDCDYCDGTGEIVCKYCNSDGTIDCDTCGGDGDFECEDCYGSGHYDDEGEERPELYSDIEKEFGVCPDESVCPTCEEEECWTHIPVNMIRDIHVDGSIDGLEFLLYGSNISSEEFAKRLPLNSLKKYFIPTEADGMHIHALLKHEALPIPDTILRNSFQLFRAYYLGWAYLFGNQKETILRDNEYSSWNSYDVNAIDDDWFLKACDRSGFNVLNINNREEENCRTIKNGVITNFDVEIRSSDSTLDLEQIIAGRAMTRALILRASELSNYGIVKMPNELWSEVKPVIKHLNKSEHISSYEINIMKKNAESFIREMMPYLTEFERKCVKNIFESPVRHRTEAQMSSGNIVLKLSDDAKEVKRIIALGSIEAPSSSKWISLVSEQLHISNEKVREALNQMKAKYDSELGTFITIDIK